MRKLLVTSGLQNYGASKTSTNVNTALTPYDLREGAIGIYGIARVSANNADKLALIGDGATDAAGLITDENRTIDWVQIAVGTASGAWLSPPISVPANKGTSLHVIRGQEYAGDTKQVFGVGYTGSVGALNLPSTIYQYDAAEVKIIDTELMDEGGAIYTDKDNYNVAADAGESAYSILAKLVAVITADLDRKVGVKISHNGTGSAFANSATVTAVYGATSLTTSANHGVGVGDYVSLGGDLYQAKTGTATTTLVLDRPYAGASATIANASTVDLGATIPTTLGLLFTSLEVGKNFRVSVGGILEDAEITYVTAGAPGTPTSRWQEVEAELKGLLGSADSINRYMPFPPDKVVAATNYDAYTIISRPVNRATGDTVQQVHNVYDEIIVLFADGNNPAQDDFEEIMGQLLYAADLADTGATPGA